MLARLFLTLILIYMVYTETGFWTALILLLIVLELEMIRIHRRMLKEWIQKIGGNLDA